MLLTGASGLLGNNLIPILRPHYEIVSIGRTAPLVQVDQIEHFTLDLTNPASLNEFLNSHRFDLIINCAAMTDVDFCERNRENAKLINSESVKQFSSYSHSSETLLVHISTDFVFDGHSGPYPESFRPHPINYYGTTKMEAENFIIYSGCHYVIIRTSHIYGINQKGGARIVQMMKDKIDNGLQYWAAIDQYINPTLASNLAESILELLKIDFRGVINIAGAEYLSRYEIAKIVASKFGLDKNMIIEKEMKEIPLAAARPLRAGLNIDKMKMTIPTKPVGISEGLEILKKYLGK